MPSQLIGKCSLFLILFAGLQMPSWSAGTTQLQKVDSPDTRRAIQLQVKEGIDVGGGKPGFKLSLSDWPPGVAFDVYGLDTDGTRVSLVNGETTDASGAALVAVPYEHPGLHPGAWIIGVTSMGLTRGERLLIPRVMRDKRGWHLDFKSLSQQPAPSPRHP